MGRVGLLYFMAGILERMQKVCAARSPTGATLRFVLELAAKAAGEVGCTGADLDAKRARFSWNIPSVTMVDERRDPGRA